MTLRKGRAALTLIRHSGSSPAVSVPRSELVGKSVYDQEAKLIGAVHDIALKIGEKEITLIVRTPGGTTVEVPWDKVAAVKDIVLLKEKVELPPEALKPAAPAAAAAPEHAHSAPLQHILHLQAGEEDMPLLRAAGNLDPAVPEVVLLQLRQVHRLAVSH
jgi:sporulation protein YlmC with PRC-barrel domain